MQSVLHTKDQGGEISFFLSPPLASSALRGERQNSDTEVNLEAGDALGGAKWTRRSEVDSQERSGLGGAKWTRRSEVDSEETWSSTFGRRGSDAHLTRVH